MAASEELGFARKMSIMIILVFGQLVQMIPFGSGLCASLAIAVKVNASQSEASWIAASYPMTQGAFILIGGRIGDVYGHKNVLLAGLAWWIIFELVTGFAKTIVVVSLFRGLTGIGAAFVVPNAIGLLTHTFPPGKLRNISMGLFGAMAPLGAAGGTVFAALLVQLTEWKWLFFFLAMLGALVFVLTFAIIPNGPAVDPAGGIDWIGAYLGVGGLILFNFVWNQAPIVGWDTVYIYVLLIVSVIHLIAFLFWEAKVAKAPILPFDIWRAPSFLLVVVVVFLSTMSFGNFIWYFSMYIFQIHHQSLLSAAAQVMPLTVGGAMAAFTAAWLIPRLHAQYILAIGASCMTVSSILLATVPADRVYWRGLFWAISFAAFCPDFVFTAAQIISSNSVKRSQLGVAGSLIGTLFTYGMSTGIGFGGTVEAYTNKGGEDILGGFRKALYLGIGLSATGIIISLAFIRIRKDVREGWDDKEDASEEGVVQSSEKASESATVVV